jgi:quinol monooxygenase YgiN
MTTMAKVLVKANVAYPGSLLSVLEGFDRKPFGELSYAVDLDEDIPNHVYITFNWASLAKAKDFWKSPMAKPHVESWHSVSQPEFVFLRNLPGEAAA